MTDEQLLAYYFITDLGTKGVQAFMLRKTANSIVDSLKQNTIAIRESQGVRPTQPVQPTQTTQQTQTASNDDDYAEIQSEVIYDKPKAKAKPMTPLQEQVSYFEPEEESVYSQLTDRGGFKEDYVAPNGMPNFGDKDILSELERLSGEPTKPVRKPRAKAKAPARKPRAKK